MNKLTTGMIVGGLIGMASAGYMSSSDSAKRKMMKKGKKVINKAEHMMDDITSGDMW